MRALHQTLGLSVVQVEIDRANIINSCYVLMFIPQNQLRISDIDFRFKNEESHGLGVIHEFFTEFCNVIRKPDTGLLVEGAADVMMMNPDSKMIQDDYLYFYEMFGMIIGLALIKKHTLDLPLSPVFFKSLTGESIDVDDLCPIDPVLYSSLKWMLDNDIEEVGFEQNFVFNRSDNLGNKVEYVLKPGGETIEVTNKNKDEYVVLVVEYILKKSVIYNWDSLQAGFFRVCAINTLNAQEMCDVLCSEPDLDVENWKQHTQYQGCTEDSERINWFWECLTEFDMEERNTLLQFCTGLRRLPFNTFEQLDPKFVIAEGTLKDGVDVDKTYPTSNTCIHQLIIPEYTNKNILDAKLKAVLNQASGFGYI